MAIETFSWGVESGDSGNEKFRVRSAQFGDGYRQESGDGLNSSTRSWPISITGKPELILPIREFLKRHGGYKSFLWEDPTGLWGMFKSKEFNIQPIARDVLKLTTIFEESYAP